MPNQNGEFGKVSADIFNACFLIYCKQVADYFSKKIASLSRRGRARGWGVDDKSF
jgi:hypothetical protein